MIVDERMVTYIHSLETPENSLLEEIEKEALDTYVPIIRKETKSFLKTLITMNRPMNILEVGTAVGFSALVMNMLRQDVRLLQLRIMINESRLPARILRGQGKNRTLPC